MIVDIIVVFTMLNAIKFSVLFDISVCFDLSKKSVSLDPSQKKNFEQFDRAVVEPKADFEFPQSHELL